MKKLKDHVILYDAVCPMCNLYTKGFVKSGMLDQNGRLPYQNMPDKLTSLVDKERSVNEIALVHVPSGKVYYGVESLLRVIGNSLPFLKPLFRCKPFIKIADRLYKFISFNRRLIIPAKKDEVFSERSEPTFHKGYRVAYLIFTWLVTAFILHKFSLRLIDILPQSNFVRELLICGGQMVWQGIAVLFLDRGKTWDYLGNMMTISFAGAILLFLIMIVGKLFLFQSPFLYAGLFGFVVTLMLLEHTRRTRLLEIDRRMTLSWVLYRFVVLLIVLIPAYAE